MLRGSTHIELEGKVDLLSQLELPRYGTAAKAERGWPEIAWARPLLRTCACNSVISQNVDIGMQYIIETLCNTFLIVA